MGHACIILQYLQCYNRNDTIEWNSNTLSSSLGGKNVP